MNSFSHLKIIFAGIEKEVYFNLSHKLKCTLNKRQFSFSKLFAYFCTSKIKYV